jgi:hypothetical protein
MEKVKYHDNLSTTDKLLFFILEELEQINKKLHQEEKPIEEKPIEEKPKQEKPKPLKKKTTKKKG